MLYINCATLFYTLCSKLIMIITTALFVKYQRCLTNMYEPALDVCVCFLRPKHLVYVQSTFLCNWLWMSHIHSHNGSLAGWTRDCTGPEREGVVRSILNCTCIVNAPERCNMTGKNFPFFLFIIIELLFHTKTARKNRYYYHLSIQYSLHRFFKFACLCQEFFHCHFLKVQ